MSTSPSLSLCVSFNSRHVNLNGKLLKMVDDSTFPELLPRPLPVGSAITLPPMTYGFYVIKDANAAVCRGTHQ